LPSCQTIEEQLTKLGQIILESYLQSKKKILDTARTIAVVGLSSDRTKPGFTVPAYLQRAGYRIIPVNPNLETALGEKAYPDLHSVPEPIDGVVIFRRPEYIVPIVEEAIEIGAKFVWMQLGIVNHKAARLAREAGLDVVMDACMMVEHRALGIRNLGSGNTNHLALT
jgi:predicted CoA-binding protein